MGNQIFILPEHIANQIAAGEVVQRPASIVKEFLENSIDSGAGIIKVWIEESGKKSIKILDNGTGMNPSDALECFQRHATSKIKKAEDLFAIATHGFRGEALASIASVAMVELKTRQEDQETGTCIQMEGSKLVSNQACNCPVGTQISAENIFYNIPARRKFLKKDATEMRYIISEFQRVALAYPNIEMHLFHNGHELFLLKSGNLQTRIGRIFGRKYMDKLVPIQEDTDLVKITGFIGKPDMGVKISGKSDRQFFFVNKRYIKHPYFSHAIGSAFENILPKDHAPSFFINLEVHPSKLDINIHPTKTEIKFEDEKAIYAFLKSATKRSLGKFNIIPSIDFSLENSFQVSHKPPENIQAPGVTIDPSYNPFSFSKPKANQGSDNPFREIQNLRQAASEVKTKPEDWKDFYTVLKEQSENEKVFVQQELKSFENKDYNPSQLDRKYIICFLSSGLALISQQRAHQRILFEYYIACLAKEQGHAQMLLFPLQMDLGVEDFNIVASMKNELSFLGFELEAFGQNTMIIHGAPEPLHQDHIETYFKDFIEDFKASGGSSEVSTFNQQIARSMAISGSIKSGQTLTKEEMNVLLQQLFECEKYHLSPNGLPVLINFSLGEINSMFNK